MDDLDHRLIALLRSDARQPVASLAAATGVARSTVKARIDRLVASGTIQGFTVLLREAGRRDAVRAVMMVEVDGRHAERVISRLRGFPEIRSLQTTNGRWDIVATIETDTLQAFDDTLRRVRLVDGISATETSILLAQRKADIDA
jgi:DNA-binding Lrp family transcriptional regulator